MPTQNEPEFHDDLEDELDRAFDQIEYGDRCELSNEEAYELFAHQRDGDLKIAIRS